MGGEKEQSENRGFPPISGIVNPAENRYNNAEQIEADLNENEQIQRGFLPMIDDIMNTAKEKMQKSCAVYERDMAGLRAGRANPTLLDRIMVDYYGTPTPINQVGNISSPEPRLLVIAPWEAKMIPQIEKAIQKSDLGINPSNDGKIIRLVFPELNEERRRDLTKIASKGAEETKVAIRSIRRDAIEQIKKMKKNSEITEDDQHDAEEKMQKLTDKAIKDVDEIFAKKEKEIMEV